MSRVTSPSLPTRPAHVLMGFAVLAAMIAMTTSEEGLARIFAVIDRPHGLSIELDPPKTLSEQEKEALIVLTETPGPTSALTPTEAVVRNKAIPFTAAPVAAARPFANVNLADGSGLTALQCMTQAVYYEAGFEPLEGRQAVAQVILNRVMHPAFPKSVCGVVYQGVNRPVCQFSFTCDGSLNRPRNGNAWREAEIVARAALGGFVATAIGYSTHYHANYVSPYWATKLVKIVQIGAHIFYRWPGNWGMPDAFAGQYAGNESIPALLPRSMFARRASDPDAQTRALAEGQLPPNLVPASHADSDVGGRLDVSKGWTLDVPDPAETRISASMVAHQQGGEYSVPATRGGS